MENKQNKKLHSVLFVIILLAVFAAAVIIIVSVTRNSQNRAGTAQGIQYIKTMEEKSPSEIENQIFNASKQKLLDEMTAVLDEDPGQVWNLLDDVGTVICGDSRAAGFFVFDYMDESRVLAYAGATIWKIEEDYETIRTLNPKLLVLSYGINDYNSRWLFDTTEDYCAKLDEIMATLTEMLPDAYIYFQSTFPVTETGLEESPNWANIPTEWDPALKAHCEEMGWRYLDLSDLIADYMDAYDIDGIHIQSYFYPHWAEAILRRYLQDSIMES